MRKEIGVLVATLVSAWWISGCGNGTLEGRETGETDPVEAEIGSPPANSSFVEREFWLALVTEPAWHLDYARRQYLDGENRNAAEELAKVAAILNFETRHSHSERERGLLLASVSELGEVARQLRLGEDPGRGGPSLAEFDRVSALAYRTIAAHDVTLGREALEAGDAHMAGRYMGETVKALEAGFERGGIPLGNALKSDLDRARTAAMGLESQGIGTREEGFSNLDRLDKAVLELGEVLTSRRK